METDRQLDTKQFGEWKTNEQERKFGDVENHLYWDSRLAGGRRVLRTTKRQFCFKGFCLVFCGCGSIVRVQETWP